MAKTISWFKDSDLSSLDQTGELGAKIGELYSMNLPVNLGFVITASAFDEFIDNTAIREKLNTIFSNASITEPKSMITASEEAAQVIMSTDIPAYLQERILNAYHNVETGGERFAELNSTAYAMISAGRAKTPEVMLTPSLCSEATGEYPFFGTKKTFNNIRGDENLLNMIKKTWLCLYSPESIYYFKKRGFFESSVSITIQKMLDAEQSGIAFSINPLTGDKEIVIEAVWGWPKTLEQGSLKPDSYKLDAETLQVKERRINKQEWALMRDLRTLKETKKELSRERSYSPVLSDEVIKRAALLVRKVEQKFNKPHMVRFAVVSNRVYITGVNWLPFGGTPSNNPQIGGEVKKVSEGLPTSNGLVSGNSKLISNEEDLTSIRPGDIIAVKNLTTKIIPYFENITGLISINGGLCSEVALLARELGKPVITQANDFTSLDDNDSIILDAVNGVLYSRESPVQYPSITSIPEQKFDSPFPSFLEQANHSTTQEQNSPVNNFDSFSYQKNEQILQPQTPSLSSQPITQTQNTSKLGINLIIESLEGSFLQELVQLCARYGVAMNITSQKSDTNRIVQQSQKKEDDTPIMPFW